jgi:vang-like
MMLLNVPSGPALPMDSFEAAQAIFPSLARALQKYLRITRQQPRYTMDSVLDHLAMCVSHDLSAKAFVERYVGQGSVAWNDPNSSSDTQNWILVSDQNVSRSIDGETVFELRHGDVSLLVTVRRMPHFNITEDVIDPKNNKWVLRLQSETSV